MTETIKEFFSSPEMIALVTTAISFLTANLGTLIVFAIKYLRLKAKEMKAKAQSEEVIAQLTAQYNAKIEEFAQHIDMSLDEIEKVVIKKVQEKQDAMEEQIKHETISLEEAIKETKKALNIEE